MRYILKSHPVSCKESVTQEYIFEKNFVCVCVSESAYACPLKPLPSGDPGVQNGCLGSGHLGQASPSVSQICFLTHKPNQAGNHHSSAWLRSRSLVISQKPYNTAQHAVTLVQTLNLRSFWGKKTAILTPIKPHQYAKLQGNTYTVKYLIHTKTLHKHKRPAQCLQLFICFHSWVHAIVHHVCVYLSAHQCVSISLYFSRYPLTHSPC